MKILITGTSSGIGNALAHDYLKNRAEVLGISRSVDEELAGKKDYYHLSQDLGDLEDLQSKIEGFTGKGNTFDLAILNAGILPTINDMRKTSLAEIKKVMDINVWSNKVILDTLLDPSNTVHQVVAISSGAAVSGARGWNAYSLSKATLNMLIQLYANEIPETHFSALAPGIIDTGMQEYIASLPDNKYEVVDRLKSMRGTSQMPPPEDAATYLVKAIEHVLRFESGSFLDVRDLYQDE
jgi:NAD(P)-dependent dehydrogenase (short-subunit alcohol dehydrogenase family)